MDEEFGCPTCGKCDCVCFEREQHREFTAWLLPLNEWLCVNDLEVVKARTGDPEIIARFRSWFEEGVDQVTAIGRLLSDLPLLEGLAVEHWAKV